MVLHYVGQSHGMRDSAATSEFCAAPAGAAKAPD